MTGSQDQRAALAGAEDEKKRALLHFLRCQRDSVLSIVEKLEEEAWHRPVVPSGWTPAELVEHLGDAEQHWFGQVVAGSDAQLPRDAGRPPMTRRRRSSVTGPQLR